MLNPREIRDMLRRRPFEPLEFLFSDGTKETVRHPDNAIVTGTSIGIGQFDRNSEIPDWTKTYALVHLVSVEPSRAQPSSR